MHQKRLGSWVLSASAVGFVATTQISCGGGKTTGGGHAPVTDQKSQDERALDSTQYETNLVNSAGTSTVEKEDGGHHSDAAYGFSRDTIRKRIRGLGGEEPRALLYSDTQSATSGPNVSAARPASNQAAPAGLTNAQRIARIGAGFNETMLQCANRIWPGYSWANLSVYVTDRSAKTAWLWRGGGRGAISPLDFSRVPSEHHHGWFSFGKDVKKREMGLSLSDTAEINQILNASLSRGDFLVDLGIHEAFHYFFQNRPNWVMRASDGGFSRAVEYPLDPMPRYLRFMIADKLLGYLRKPSPALLGQARGLLNSYLSRYSKEAAKIASTDQLEGSAAYVEMDF